VIRDAWCVGGEIRNPNLETRNKFEFGKRNAENGTGRDLTAEARRAQRGSNGKKMIGKKMGFTEGRKENEAPELW
jgi:hypothetical protein